MPHSRPEGKPWIIEKIVGLDPSTILDVGVGAGTYWNLLHDKVAAYWTGIEIFEPYVEQFDLTEKYDRLIVGDFLTVPLDSHDVVILGDVLEHVSQDQAGEMWDKARSLGTVLLTLPLDHFVQGPVNGNTHETHLHHWSHFEVLSLGGITDYWVGPRKGCYVA